MWKWLGGIVAAVLIWWLTQGALEVIKRPVPQAPSPTPTPAFSVTGSWNYSMKSNVSGNTHTGAMILTQDGSLVSGILEKTFDNSKTGLKGTLLGNTLELVRDTGLDTIQTYRLSKSSDNQMTGMFENVGKYPDSGSIELQR